MRGRGPSAPHAGALLRKQYLAAPGRACIYAKPGVGRQSREPPPPQTAQQLVPAAPHTPATHQPHTSHTSHIPATHQPYTSHAPATHQPRTSHTPAIWSPRSSKSHRRRSSCARPTRRVARSGGGCARSSAACASRGASACGRVGPHERVGGWVDGLLAAGVGVLCWTALCSAANSAPSPNHSIPAPPHLGAQLGHLRGVLGARPHCQAGIRTAAAAAAAVGAWALGEAFRHAAARQRTLGCGCRRGARSAGGVCDPRRTARQAKPLPAIIVDGSPAPHSTAAPTSRHCCPRPPRPACPRPLSRSASPSSRATASCERSTAPRGERNSLFTLLPPRDRDSSTLQPGGRSPPLLRMYRASCASAWRATGGGRRGGGGRESMRLAVGCVGLGLHSPALLRTAGALCCRCPVLPCT